QRRAQRGEQAERDERPAAELRRARSGRVQAAGPQPDRLEEAGGSGQAVTTEGSEQLLGAVPDEEHADDDAQDQQGEFHDQSLPRKIDCAYKFIISGPQSAYG